MWGRIPANISVWLGRRVRGKLLNCEKLYPLTATLVAPGGCCAVIYPALSAHWNKAQLFRGGSVRYLVLRRTVSKGHVAW